MQWVGGVEGARGGLTPYLLAGSAWREGSVVDTVPLTFSFDDVPAGRHSLAVYRESHGFLDTSSVPEVWVGALAIQNPNYNDTLFVSSFQGGAPLTVGGSPIAANHAEMSICGLPCREVSVTAGRVQCKTPCIATNLRATPTCAAERQRPTSQSRRTSAQGCETVLDFGPTLPVQATRLVWRSAVPGRAASVTVSFSTDNSTYAERRQFNISGSENVLDVGTRGQYRYVNVSASFCPSREVELWGRRHRTLTAADDWLACDVSLRVGGSEFPLPDSVYYFRNMTAVLPVTSVEDEAGQPVAYISPHASTTIRLIIENIVFSNLVVTIDGISAAVDPLSTQYVKCVV